MYWLKLNIPDILLFSPHCLTRFLLSFPRSQECMHTASTAETRSPASISWRILTLVDHLYNPEANLATSSASLSLAPGICTPAPTAQENAETHPWTRGCGACWWTDQASSGPAPQSKPCTWPAGRTAGTMPVLAPPPPALSWARRAYPGHRASGMWAISAK